ncbi:response regulator [Massilia sp. PAMC28688]|uniref:response regulator n=1 Tax=Massilia sp. PAMC28688 TaxID=2861283 RepID=UPI001C636FEA|nr:response regulator [Massilia sp. PAMC28688]QYF95537.1 response regulator [Massilia sp. PAMC28688]
MLKAVIVDASALSRGLLNTVLTDGGYDVVGQSHTSSQGFALLQKYQPQLFCIALEQMEDGSGVVEQIRAQYPKTLVFMLSGALDAATLQAALARGVNGFIVKPFRADAVLKTIRATVLALVKRQQAQS